MAAGRARVTPSVLVTVMSATGVTAVVAIAVLLPPTPSASTAATVEVLTMGAIAAGSTRTV